MLPCQTPFKDVLIGVDPWLVLVHLAVLTSQPHLARAANVLILQGTIMRAIAGQGK